MELHGFAFGPFKTNCYVFAHDGHCVVIDPGMHSHDRLVAFVEEHSLVVDKILLTHGHVDHTRDAGTLARRWGVDVYIHPLDAPMLEDPSIAVSTETSLLFDAPNMAPYPNSLPLEDGQVLELAGVPFRIAHAPGHSPGSVLIVGDEVVFSGDVLFQGSIGRTDLPHSSPADMDATLRGPVLSLTDSLHVLPGHGPATTMRAERMSNPFLRQAILESRD